MKKQIRERLKTIAEQLLNREKEFRVDDLKEQVLELYNQITVLEYLEKLIDDEKPTSSKKGDTVILDQYSHESQSDLESDHIDAQFEPFSAEEDVQNELSLSDFNFTPDFPENNATEDVIKENLSEKEDLAQGETFVDKAKIDEEDSHVESIKNSEPVFAESNQRLSQKEEAVTDNSPKENHSEKERSTQEKTSADATKADEEDSPVASKPQQAGFEQHPSDNEDASPDHNSEEPTGEQEIVIQNELELFAASYQRMPEFERKEPASAPKKSEPKTTNTIFQQMPESKPRSLNESINRGMSIGLNDRLAFIKHLFEGRTEDYSRVLSQLGTFETFDEARRFLENQVSPDYNHWETKDEYVVRFFSIIEKRFS